MADIRIVWQVWNTWAHRAEMSSYSKGPALEWARARNAGLAAPCFTVERCHLVAGRAV